MKHILIACLVFALCLAVGLFSLFYVRASGEETVTLLERSIRQAEEEQYTAASESLRQAKQLWEGRETVLGIFLHHESNEKTETAKFGSYGSHFPRFLFFCKRL